MPRILVFCGGGIGDVMMTTPVFRAIKTRWPNADLVVAVRQTVSMQLLDESPFVDQLIDMNQHGLFSLLKEIKKHHFDICIHNHSCQSIIYYVLPFLARIPVRVGFNRYLIKQTWINKLKPLLLTEKLLYIQDAKRRTRMNLDLLKFINTEWDDEDYDLFLGGLKGKNKDVVGIHPGCDNNGAIKRWPIERFVEFAERVSKQGKRVVFFIGPAEEEIAKFIRTSEYVSIQKPKNLKELIKEVNHCGVFISNDNGPAHLAAGLKVPTIVIYGPTKKAEFVLPTNYVAIEPVGFDCSNCFRNKSCDNGGACLNSISVDRVVVEYSKLSKALEEESQID